MTVHPFMAWAYFLFGLFKIGFNGWEIGHSQTKTAPQDAAEEGSAENILHIQNGKRVGRVNKFVADPDLTTARMFSLLMTANHVDRWISRRGTELHSYISTNVDLKKRMAHDFGTATTIN